MTWEIMYANPQIKYVLLVENTNIQERSILLTKQKQMLNLKYINHCLVLLFCWELVLLQFMIMNHNMIESTKLYSILLLWKTIGCHFKTLWIHFCLYIISESSNLADFIPSEHSLITSVHALWSACLLISIAQSLIFSTPDCLPKSMVCIECLHLSFTFIALNICSTGAISGQEGGKDRISKFRLFITFLVKLEYWILSYLK